MSEVYRNRIYVSNATKHRVEQKNQLEIIAFEDSLTGLKNRMYLNRYMDKRTRINDPILSIGISKMESFDDDVEQAIRTADQAMYMAEAVDKVN